MLLDKYLKILESCLLLLYLVVTINHFKNKRIKQGFSFLIFSISLLILLFLVK